jgi:hypothetical protein
MASAVRSGAFVIGMVVVAGTLASVFTTLVVPRAASSRLLRITSTNVAATVRMLAQPVRTDARRERLLSYAGPLGLVLLFVVWLGLLLGGFGLIAWWSSGSTLGHALGIAASSVFTLGIATGRHPGTTVLEVLAAATGLGVVALEIAYLPTLYAAFSAREAEVTLLATRAGTPAWGPEILVRHQWFHTMAELPDLYATWERWSALVAETHANYPSLMWFRSPVPSRSWLTGLTAMLDAAALHDATCPGSAPRQSRNCLQMGADCLRSLAEPLRIPFDPDPLPTTDIRLTFDEFSEGYRRLLAVGFPVERPVEEAWRHFAGWRVNYEAIIDQLTSVLSPPPAPWCLPRPGASPVALPRVLDRTPDDPGADQNPE